MGQHRGAYQADYPAGARVRIISMEELLAFKANPWRFLPASAQPAYPRHNPLTDEQLAFASQIAVVKSVYFYHGGDELYVLEDVPGVWHEQWLEAADSVG
jgi:hypothetical protein